MKLILEIHPSRAAARARANILNAPPGGGAPKPNVRVVEAEELALFDESSNPGTEMITAKSSGPIFLVLFDEP